MHLLRQAVGFALLAVVPLAIIVAETPKPMAKKKSTGTATKKKGPTTTTASKKAGTSHTAKKGTTASHATTTKKRAASTKGRPTAPRPPARQRQMQPSADRYRETKLAWAGKGYLRGKLS